MTPFPRRDGNRYRRIRHTPNGLLAVRQRRLYDYGFQRGDDTEHPLEWIGEMRYRRKRGLKGWPRI